jgi:hypothetical protein
MPFDAPVHQGEGGAHTPVQADRETVRYYQRPEPPPPARQLVLSGCD